VTKGQDPIRIELQGGRVRYRFTIDMGRRPDGGRDQRRFTLDTLKEAKAERAMSDLPFFPVTRRHLVVRCPSHACANASGPRVRRAVR
jgi:hypothetical protein